MTTTTMHGVVIVLLTTMVAVLIGGNVVVITTSMADTEATEASVIVQSSCVGGISAIIKWRLKL